MTKLSKKFSRLISKELKKTIMPIKTEHGIQVGDITIESHGSLKTIRRRDQVIMSNIYLNTTAIKLAERLAKGGQLTTRMMEIYQSDQYYGRWYTDSEMLRFFQQRAAARGDYNRADVLQARYSEGRYRMMMAKSRVEYLAQKDK